MKKWKGKRRFVTGDEAVLMDTGLQKFRDLTHRVTVELGLAELDVTPYTLRYGVVTSDKFYFKLSDEEIQRRGGWTETKTFRQYVQVAGLLKQDEKVLEDVGRWAEEICSDSFRHFQV